VLIVSEFLWLKKWLQFFGCQFRKGGYQPGIKKAQLINQMSLYKEIKLFFKAGIWLIFPAAKQDGSSTLY